MRYVPFSIFLLVGPTASGQLQVTNVFYGERDTARTPLAIYFDKNGDVYPNYFIADTSLERSNASLAEWYAIHPSGFSEIAQKYRCAFQDYSPANVQILNDSIAAGIASQINSEKSRHGSVTVVVHGFRKPFKENENDYTSEEDYQVLEETLSGFGLQTLYVKVYWDALYGCCFGLLNFATNKSLLRSFETAQQQALPVARQFRKFLTRVQFDTLNLVSHSLGARVITEALFNASAEATDPTPLNKRLNICLIAPAMAGVETFQHYYRRNPAPNPRTADNYRLAIVYNEDDFVLRKQVKKVFWIGPGPYKYGNTTLGCNYDGAATKLQAYFETHYPNSVIKLFDLTGNVGKCHFLGQCYCDGDNLKEMVNFMKE